MTTYLEISTPYLNHYIVNQQGLITQYKGQKIPPQFSSGWRLLGLCRVDSPFHTIFTLDELFTMNLETIQWKYKNGKPQYTVADLDHGTIRVWGNISLIRKIELEGMQP
jgi:hypothetical protein